MDRGQTLPAEVDTRFMTRALHLARTAEAMGEVPVGCVVVRDGMIMGEAYNAPIGTHDPAGHAEIRALRMAGRAVGNYRLVDCDLYVTLEPCAMCAGAMVHARLRRVIFGARDEKTGAAGSVFDLLSAQQNNHQVNVTDGVLSAESSEMLSGFFQRRREQRKAERERLRAWFEQG